MNVFYMPNLVATRYSATRKNNFQTIKLINHMDISNFLELRPLNTNEIITSMVTSKDNSRLYACGQLIKQIVVFDLKNKQPMGKVFASG